VDFCGFLFFKKRKDKGAEKEEFMEGIVDFFTNGIWGILAAAVGIIIYIIPTIIALSKRHSQRTGIILLNIFLGWTLAGWLGAFIWALAKD
jgi:hypothetical protein